MCGERRKMKVKEAKQIREEETRRRNPGVCVEYQLPSGTTLHLTVEVLPNGVMRLEDVTSMQLVVQEIFQQLKIELKKGEHE